MIDLEWKTPKSVSPALAGRVRAARKSQKISMRRLSELSGVSFASVRRFETTGEISLTSLIKIAIVPDRVDNFDKLFGERPPKSIEEIIRGNL